MKPFITPLNMTLYRMLWHGIAPLMPLYLNLRAAQGKEVKARLAERYGQASKPRPKGRVYWLHAASVGEAISALTLAEAMLKIEGEHKPKTHILITSGTTTSQKIIAQRTQAALKKRIIHQFHPHDHPQWIARFLNHWNPQLTVMMESEIWPNMIDLSHKKNIPIAMASAQISQTSLKKWHRFGKKIARNIFPKINLIAAADKQQLKRFQSLGLQHNKLIIGGAMKAAAQPLPDTPKLKDAIVKAASSRKIILYASSHQGEEDIFIKALNSLAPTHAYFAIIAPRHIERGAKIHAMLAKHSKNIGRRSIDNLPTPPTSWWVHDAMGEMGALIRSAHIIVLGGGFAPLGGHNPMEMATLGKSVISGRNTFKNESAFALLEKNNAVIFADTTAELAKAIARLTTSPKTLKAYDKAAENTAKNLAQNLGITAKKLLQLAQKNADDKGITP